MPGCLPRCSLTGSNDCINARRRTSAGTPLLHPMLPRARPEHARVGRRLSEPNTSQRTHAIFDQPRYGKRMRHIPSTTKPSVLSNQFERWLAAAVNRCRSQYCRRYDSNKTRSKHAFQERSNKLVPPAVGPPPVAFRWGLLPHNDTMKL